MAGRKHKLHVGCVFNLSLMVRAKTEVEHEVSPPA